MVLKAVISQILDGKQVSTIQSLNSDNVEKHRTE